MGSVVKRGRGRGRGSMGLADPEEALHVGNYYNPDKRREEVRNKLNSMLHDIRRDDLHKNDGGSQSSSSTSYLSKLIGNNNAVKEERKDMITIKLETILADVETLAESVKEFAGPHFTKNYRTLQGDCTKFQSDLDRLEVSGREDIRKKRREALVRIDELAKALAMKTHDSGKSCNDCEVQD